jgi:hypothetical protein
MDATLKLHPAASWGALGFLGLALGLAALWLALNFALPQLQDTGVAFVVIRLVIHAALLVGIWLGLARTGFAGAKRMQIWLALAIPLTAWLSLVWWLAIAIFLPVLLVLPVLLSSKQIGALLDATPAAWLIALQVYRIFGGIFLLAWVRGGIAGIFALPAGIGDVLVGTLALPVAYLVGTGAPGARQRAMAWNLLGLFDFAVAIAIGIVTAPGPLQLIVPERPNAALGTFPMVMIPAFAVPSSILLHALSLRQLLRIRKAVRKAQ